MLTTEPTAAPAICPLPVEDEDVALAGEGEDVGERDREVVRGFEEMNLAEGSCAGYMSTRI